MTPNNVQLLSEGICWLHEHFNGVIGLNFDYWSTWSDGQFPTPEEQHIQVMHLLLAFYRSEHPLRQSNFEDKVHSYLRGKEAEPCAHCRIGEKEIAVSADGTLFPCSRLVGRAEEDGIHLGNVHTGINRSAQLRLIDACGNRTPACALCGLRHRCLDSCGCTNLTVSGHWDRVSPFLCSCEKLCIHSADMVTEQFFTEKNTFFLHRFYGSSASGAQFFTKFAGK